MSTLSMRPCTLLAVGELAQVHVVTTQFSRNETVSTETTIVTAHPLIIITSMSYSAVHTMSCHINSLFAYITLVNSFIHTGTHTRTQHSCPAAAGLMYLLMQLIMYSMGIMWVMRVTPLTWLGPIGAMGRGEGGRLFMVKVN